MRQIFHHYEKWEDYQQGMWKKVCKSDYDVFLKNAIAFTGDYKLYGKWMKKVLPEWPISCEQNLSDPLINRKAWIGHAATFLAIKCPEYITRCAWGYLSKNQQDLANEQAQIAIEIWEKYYSLPAQLTFENINVKQKITSCLKYRLVRTY